MSRVTVKREKVGKNVSEHQIQARLFTWIEDTRVLQTDELKKETLKYIHAIPNGYYRGFAARRKAKAEGVKSGIHDIFVPAPAHVGAESPSPRFHGLYVEMKKPGGRISSEQRAFGEYLTKIDYRWECFDDWRDAARAIVRHLALTEFAPIPEQDDLYSS